MEIATNNVTLALSRVQTSQNQVKNASLNHLTDKLTELKNYVNLKFHLKVKNNLLSLYKKME